MKITMLKPDRYEIRFRPEGRYSKEKKRVFKTKKECREFYSEFMTNYEEEEIQKDKALFGIEADRWYESSKKLGRSANYLKALVSQLNFWKQRFGEKEISKITKLEIKEAFNDLSAKDYKKKTVNHFMGTFWAIINHALDDEVIKERPFKSVPKHSMQKVSRKQLPWEQEDAMDFLRFVDIKYKEKDRWIYVVYLLALNTGMRAGEVWGLKKHKIKSGFVLVDEQFERVSGKLTQPKWASIRSVPIDDDIMNELDMLTKLMGRYDFVFKNQNGGAINHDNFTKRVLAKDLKAWGGPKITFHKFRDLAATFMLENGMPIHIVKDILGHKDISTTAIYLNTSRKGIKKASEKYSLKPSKVSSLKLVN